MLTSALLVVTVTLPLVPSYLASYLPDLFDIFIELATIRQTERLGKGRIKGFLLFEWRISSADVQVAGCMLS